MSSVRYSEQVGTFIKTCPPETRRRLRDALHALAKGKGDIRALEREFSGFCRLRVGRYRIVFHYRPGKHGPECFCDYAQYRDVVYEQFAAVLSEEGSI